MKVTKYEHATLVVEEQGNKLVIDPGTFTTSLQDFSNVAGVVITHAHSDHFDKNLVEKILAANPEAKIFTVAEVAEQLAEHQANVVTVHAGETQTVGPFTLKFYGGKHAFIRGNMPDANNVGVLVNDSLYYPGDSFSTPDGAAVKVLALPTTAPWLKIGESIDFLEAVKPKVTFPTHDGLHNDISEQMSNGMIGNLAKEQGIDFHPLKVGESLDI